ncbi:protein kinase domain-containing protein [Schlesneria sp. DSM 10557]|uniref:serine/threonine-protein kinase n=1 Tax=Schlesneria sp. DSM 10557 TaxID=3044399 RepID=UPI00359FD0F9
MSSESEPATKNQEPTPPLKSLGKYQIERKLGQGGMGTVYLARNTDLKKLVALKVLPRDKAKNPTLVRRFKAEAQAAAQLEHPNIVAVYDTGEADGYLYIAMEYVEGIDLFEQVRRRGTIPVKRSIEIIKQVASALQHAFEHNIVHRDIKPSNLLLRKDGVVKVTDLGLARSIDDTLETNITRAGTTVGTVDYMAPEQARSSKSADIRSDLYSLGCTWYQMLTGDPPFAEGSLTNKLQAHAIKDLPDPRDINENVPEGLIAVLRRMTAKKPADRYQTPAELLDDLENSKLTNAAFSNEIFSDLSDDEISTLKEQPEAEIEAVGDPESPRPSKRRRKPTPKDEPEADESDKPRARRRPLPNDEEISDEVSPPKTRRRSNSPAPDTAVDDATPLPTRSKSPRSRVDQSDDEGVDEESLQRLTGRNSLDDDEEDADPLATKRKRVSATNEGSDPTVPRNPKGTSAGSARDKQPKKFSPKPLPPKREPIPLASNEDRPAINLDPLKYVALAAVVLILVGGLGWQIVQWGNQVQTAENPFGEPVAPPTAVAGSIPETQMPQEAESDDSSATGSAANSTAAQTPPAEFDFTRQPVPEWATRPSSVPADLPAITVGPGATTTHHFTTLDEALKVASKSGGYIQLVGSGPFQLSHQEISTANRLIITPASSTDQPLVMVTPTLQGSRTALAFSNGTLELRGLHFVVDRTADMGQAPLSLISVNDGRMYVRNCSFTATGSTSAPASAFTFTSDQDAQNVPSVEPHVLLDHVVVRGNGLTALRLDRARCDVVIQDSLLVSGTTPSLVISSKPFTGTVESLSTTPQRLIRILRSTLYGRKEIFELTAENQPKPPTTALLLQDSICAAEGAGNTTVLASAVRWPSSTSSASGWLTNFTWTSQSTLYIGFERLLDLDKSSFKVANPDAWQRVWGKPFEPRQFQRFIWPETSFPDLGAIQLQNFDKSTLPFRELTASSGGLPGCTTSQLILPGTVSQARLIALSQRPAVPEPTRPDAAPPTRKVNLGREDLGAILNRNDWTSGTLFEATGSGLVTMQPARITGKSVRIVFTQAEGSPLKIQPKVPEGKSKTDIPGLFTIENGMLELQSATLEASSNTKAAPLPWLVHSTNSLVTLRGCQLSGPQLQEVAHHQGLVTWRTIAEASSSPESGPAYLALTDSLLMSNGVGIQFQSPAGQLHVRNSIVAVRGYGIDLQPARTGNALLPVINLQNVTFSASQAALRIVAAEGTAVVETPMRLYIDSCAVVPPLEFRLNEAANSTVVECVGPVLEQKQVDWWGISNGFAKELPSLLREQNKEPITAVANWMNLWGPSNDDRLLTGAKGVQLKNGLPNKWALLKISSFLLDPNSAGATWGSDGQAVGAHIGALEELAAVKKVTTDAKAGTQTTIPTVPPNVRAKKDIGF